MPCLLKLTKDDQDSVRLLTVDSLLQTTSLLTPEENKQHLLSTLKSLGQDKSWRVRFMVATHFAEVSRVKHVIGRDVCLTVGLFIVM
jgi:serine/threonine-protein phosphatase 2A regulatory subunit A